MPFISKIKKKFTTAEILGKAGEIIVEETTQNIIKSGIDAVTTASSDIVSTSSVNNISTSGQKIDSIKKNPIPSNDVE